MKTKLVIAFLAAMLTSICFAGSTYSVSFGYGVFNMAVESSAPITKIVFDYGNGDYALPAWGPINTDNAKMVATNLGNGLYEYTIAPKDPAKTPDFGTTVTFSQVPMMIDSPPTKNMPFSDYYGLFQNIQINGDNASYSDQCQGDSCTDPAPGKILGGYYADWTVYSGHGGYNPQQLPFGYLNTIYYGFGSLNPTTAAAQMFDPYADAQNGAVSAVPYLSLQRQKYPYLNLIYSYGGWGSISNDNFQSGDFSVLFKYYPQDISKLADSMVQAMLRTGFNGIDIDYEWIAPFESDTKYLGGNPPLCEPDPNNSQYCVTKPLSQVEADGYAELMYDLRQNINRLPNAKQYLLTTALISGPDKINELASFKYQGSIAALQGQSDLKIVMDNINYVGLMTYDMHGAFDAPADGTTNPSSISNFQSRFQANPNDPTPDPTIKKYNVVDSIKALQQADPTVDSKKIVVGIAAYARIVRLDTQPNNSTSAQQVGIFDPLAPFSQQAVLNTDASGEFTGDYVHQYQNGGGADEIGSTIFDYKCILQYPNDATSSECYYGGNAGSNPIPTAMTFYGMDQLPPITQPGGYAATPWGYDATNRAFMSFDNNLSAANKAKYVIQNGFGGTMVWELDGDVGPDSADFQSKSIVYALYSQFHSAGIK